MNETHSILQRMRELAVQSANDTNTNEDRTELQKEISQLQTEITRISEQTEFNTKTLMNGELGVSAERTGTNAANLGTVKVVEAGTLASDDADLEITQTVTYGDESDVGEDDGAFDNITYTITRGGDTYDVSFTKAELEAGTTSKEITIGDAKIQVGVKDATTLATDTGNGTGQASTADTFAVTDNSLTFHIGANDGQNIKLAIGDMSSSALKIDGVDISTQAGADSAIVAIDDAVKAVSQERSKLGAYQNRLEHTINNLNTSSENLTAAESRIRDVDYTEAA